MNTNVQAHVKADADTEAHGDRFKVPETASGGREEGGKSDTGPDLKPDPERRKSFVEGWTETLKERIFGRK